MNDNLKNMSFFYNIEATVATLPAIFATLPATFPMRLIEGTIFLENQFLVLGDEDENDIVFEIFS
jgi:hypothetical protein